jgi:cell division protein FtsL
MADTEAPHPSSAPLPRWASVVTTFVLIASALSFVAWAKVQTLRMTYRVEALIEREDQLAEQQRRLRAELAALRSHEHLESLAPTLALGAPKPEQIVVVTASDGVAAPDPAMPELLDDAAISPREAQP